jgi:uncharacterized protein (DUF433 family)
MAVVAEQKGQPFSVRFSKAIDLFMEEEARRQKRSKSSIVEELAEEASKSRRFPGVVFHGGGILERRAHLLGSGFDVWQLCETIAHYGSVDAVLADFSKVTEQHCRTALAYQRAYPDEIESMIARNNRPREEWEALYPFIEWRESGPAG